VTTRKRVFLVSLRRASDLANTGCLLKVGDGKHCTRFLRSAETQIVDCCGVLLGNPFFRPSVNLLSMLTRLSDKFYEHWRNSQVSKTTIYRLATVRWSPLMGVPSGKYA